MGELRTKTLPLLIATIIAVLIIGYVTFTLKPQPKDPRVAEVISGVIDAYGGEEALRSVLGFRASGIQWAVQSRAMIRVERLFGRPDRLRLELSYPDHHETRFTDGKLGWAGSSIESLKPANPLKLQAMRLQTARLDPPLRLLEYRDEIQWRGADAMGRTILRIPIEPDLYIDYHIDPETYRITRMTMGMPGPPAMEFAADYDLFHEIDGVLVAFKEVTFAGTTVTSEFQVTDFEWNPDDLETNLQPGMRAWD